MGKAQFLPGYCTLFADPAVPSINDLHGTARVDFLSDMAMLGDAIIRVTQPIRINYGILCNQHPFLHAHLFPRFEWEPEVLRMQNPWAYPEEYYTNPEYQFSEEKHGTLKRDLYDALQDVMQKIDQV